MFDKRFLKKREQIWRDHPLTGEATPVLGEMAADTDMPSFHGGSNTKRNDNSSEDGSVVLTAHWDSRPPTSSIWYSHPVWSPPQRTGCVVRYDSVQLPTSDHRKTTQLLLREKLDAISKYLPRGPTSPMWVTILEGAAPARPSLHETATSWDPEPLKPPTKLLLNDWPTETVK